MGEPAIPIFDRARIQLDVAIRPCVSADLPKLEWFGLYWAHRQIFEEAHLRHKAGENPMLVADLNGFPVGQVWIDLTASTEEGVGIIWALRVFPFFQGCGLGGRLVRAAEHVIRQSGGTIAELGIEPSERDLAPYYLRLGYTEVGTRTEARAFVTPDGRELRESLPQRIFRKPL